ncbi:MAG: polymer-forming cytoskeletal protein [Elusimicrobiota bacterium]|jgi:cytoskeletal protein CcmA (bactofilin family)|nr:polymer-forming cytoskeletal protein [Elusimicrobiota bacterium]
MSKKNSKNLFDAVETLIGATAVFNGDLQTERVVRIDGKFNGNIKAAGVMIGEEGKVVGDIDTTVFMIAGTIKGNVKATDSIEVLPTAKVEGDIETDLLTIVEGATFEGKSSKIKSSEINYDNEE